MSLCVIYPPKTVLEPLRRSDRGQMRLVEAWPGSVHTVDEFPAGEDTVPPQLFGFVLDYEGELPDDRIGILFVLRPEEVEEARAHNSAAPDERRGYCRVARDQAPWETSDGVGAPPEGAPESTTCRMVEAWPGSVQVTLGRDGEHPRIHGVVHCIENALPDRLIGAPMLLHLTDCTLRSGKEFCDCIVIDDDGQATGRRPR